MRLVAPAGDLDDPTMHEIPPGAPVLKIRDVADATGISPDNLRAWERRHGYPLPIRTSGGQRLYSHDQVCRLSEVCALLGRGLRLGQAIDLVRTRPPGGDPGPEPAPAADLAERLYAALVDLSGDHAQRVLADAAAVLALPRIADEVLQPTMYRIGEAWAAGEIGVDREHFAASWVRDWLAPLGRVGGDRSRGRLLCACVPGERHDFGLAMLAAILLRGGYEVLFLGADVPVEALVAAAAQFRPDAVLLSAADPELVSAAAQAGRALMGGLGARAPRIAVGGRAFPSAAAAAAVPGARFLGHSTAEVLSAVPDLVRTG